MSEWQPIETAPKDGTKIMVMTSDLDWPEVIYYEQYDEVTAADAGAPGFWRYADDLFADVADVDDGDFSHWMPLPEPPKP